jgi:hypothetical protein
VFLNGVPQNPGVLRSENKGPTRKSHYNIKNDRNQLNALPDLRIQLFNIKPNVKRICEEEGEKKEKPFFTLKIAYMWHICFYTSFFIYMECDLFLNMYN